MLTIPQLCWGQPATSSATTRIYSQGDPSAEEQYLLERLNAARMDPVGEGQCLADWLRNTPIGQSVVSEYGANPDQVVSDFAALPAVQPLAFNSDLITAATGHATDIAAHNGQGPNGDGHDGWDGSTLSSRVYATGLRDVAGNNPYYGECVAGGAYDLDTVHAGYLIDWGNPAFGHRQIEMNSMPQMGVVGIGLTVRTDHYLSETEDYGADVSNSAYLTGVVYNDANGNGLYDVGEGVSGVMVTVDGAACMAVTSASGGYSLPLTRPDGTNITGVVAVHMTNLPDGSTRDATVTVETVTLSNGYVDSLSVKWDAVLSQKAATSIPANPTQASIAGGGSIAKGGKLLLVVSRPADQTDLSQPLALAYTVKGSAVAYVDYQPLPGSVTIPAGKRRARLAVQALDYDITNRPAGPWILQLKLRGVKGAQGKTSVTFPE